MGITCLLLPISQATLGRFQHFGGVSESSGQAEFKTVLRRLKKGLKLSEVTLVSTVYHVCRCLGSIVITWPDPASLSLTCW